MADPFPVDPPDAAPAPAPESSPVPHDDVHAALSDALGVPAEAVHDEHENLFGGHDTGPDPYPEQRTQKAPPFDGNPSWAGEAIPGKPSDKFDVQGMNNAGVQAILRQASAEQEQPNIHGLGPDEGGGSNPDYTGENPGPQAEPAGAAFVAYAELSQRIKRTLKVEGRGFPDVEVEGFHIAAQMMAKIITGSNGDQRLLWMQLAKHCDDVAAALR